MYRLSPGATLIGSASPVQKKKAVAIVVFWQLGQNTAAHPVTPSGASMFNRITPHSWHRSETPVLLPTAADFQIVSFLLTVTLLSPGWQMPNPAVELTCAKSRAAPTSAVFCGWR